MKKIASFAALVALLATSPAGAVLTDISQSPIAVTASAQTKPNIMLLMDNSGSMGWTHMPDEVEIGGYQGSNVFLYEGGHYTVGYKSPQCNSLYYNPNVTYAVPKDPSLSFFPAATYQFTSARNAGYGSYYLTPDLSTTNLSTSFRAYTGGTLRTGAGSDAARPAYYYIYSGPQTLTPTGAACRTHDPADVNTPTFDPVAVPTTTADGATVTSAGSGGGTWTRKIVSATSGIVTRPDERENFAIWYTYYRTRLALIKSAASLAFSPLSSTNSNYRVGFITVDPKDTYNATTINATKFYVPIDDFNVTQTNTWFTKLFSQEPKTASPAREGLARVGRHYGGKQDGINNGMTGDPLQYSCQQNFTIMTTDGYWNAQTETPGAGPVGLDGVTPVGQMDGTLTADSGLSPTPIWEGQIRDTRTVTDKTISFSYATCGSFQSMTTLQVAMSTQQNTRTTSQTTQHTEQRLARTEQRSETTQQRLESTYQVTSSTLRRERSTSQTTQSTTQRRRYTTQIVQFPTQIQYREMRMMQSTNQPTQSTSQFTQSTAQTTRETRQNLQSTTRVEKRTTQTTASTTQTTRSTSQINRTDSQISRSTTQNTKSTEQRYRSTTQHRSCDSSTETCTPVASGGCTAGGFIYCETANTGPTLVASCTNETANAGNNYTATTCTSTTTGPTPVQTCTAEAPTSGNSYTRTTCGTNNSGPTPVATCTNEAATSGNAWTTTSCGTAVTGPTPVASCTNATPNAGNAFTTTSCNTVTTGPTGVASCTAVPASSGNSWTATTCGTAVTGPTGVATCTNTPASSGNSWTATTCNTTVVGYAPASSCTVESANSSNAWVQTQCQTFNTGPTPVATCTGSSGTSGNSWTTTSCSTNNTAPVGVSSCTNVPASSGNSWTQTVCGSNNTGPTGIPTACSNQAANSGNSWTSRTCNTVNTGPTPVSACFAAAKSAGNNWTQTTCGANTSGPTAVASCTNTTGTAGNNWTTTTCNDTTVTNWTNAGACTPDSGNAGNSWLRRECRISNGPQTPVASCTPTGPNGGGAGLGCATINTGPTPVASCTPQAPNAGNNWTETTCDWNNTGPTFVGGCTNQAASSGNAWTTTTCNTTVTGPTPVASCTAQTADAGNNYETVVCNNFTTGPVGVQTCTNTPPASGNGFNEVICGSVSTGPTPVASCTNEAASAGNTWRSRTCSDNNTGPTLVGTCVNQTAASGNAWTTRTCSSVVTGPAPVASCAYDAPSAGNSWVETTCTDNNTLPLPVASCTSQTRTSGNNWTETVCSTSTAVVGVASPCSNVPASSGNSWTSTTCSTVTTGPTLVVPSTCPANVAASSGNNWTSITCSPTVTGPTPVGSCTAQSANAGNNYTEITCTAASGKKQQYTVTTDITTQIFSGGVPVTAPTTTTSTSSPADVNGTCYAPSTEPALPPGGRSPQAGVGPLPAPPCGAWPCTEQTQNGIGSINSLADVAQYYYATDLRPTMTDNVPSVGSGKEDDRVNWQHMTTFVVGLGVSGTLDYRKDYKSSAATTGHFAEIRNATRAWPVWPDPAVNYSDARNYENPKAIDDFWHTAVNGRGSYFSAGDPQSVVAGLADALAGVGIRTGAGVPLGFSNYRPATGDNFAYAASYQTSNWVGDIQAAEVNLATGALGAPFWSAQSKLDLKTSAACDNRQIFLMRPSVSGGKVNFTWNTRICDGSGNPTGSPDTGLDATEQGYFDASEIGNLDHYLQMTDGSLATVNQRALAAGPALVNFLRGQRGNEGFLPNDAAKLFRTRTHVLGDIVGSQPVYVGKPKMDYQDPGYGAFKTAKAGRTAMIYAGANDGMLHAFYAGVDSADANGGKEAWAFIPQAVLPNLHRLASNNYKNTHQFFVDGSPTVADAYDVANTAWKTILVGGLNAGGKSFYAIDVTDPASPKGLWEFQWSNTCYNGTPATDSADCHLGLSFGKPVITKRASDNKWVVIVTSGYNNVSAPPKTGDGNGYLYVLDAFSGRILQKISTGPTVGDSTTPSGLAQITNYVDYPLVNNTTRQVYGGDQLGNIWRFDINDIIAPTGTEAALLGVAKDSAGNRQPITTRPELAEVNAKPMVFVGTGQLLGASDFSNTQQQSVYGFVDTMGPATVYTDLRGSLRPLALTQIGSGSTATRTVACTGTSAQCGSPSGWVIDLPGTGERMNVDMRLARGSLVFATNIPNTNACTSGGYSWTNAVEFRSGLGITTPTGVVSFGNEDGLTAGIGLIEIQGRLRGPRTFVDNRPPRNDPIPHGVPPPGGGRISWREVAN